ncbi:MAG: hypothetical protein KGL53_08680, partial [Elusimicrobia bacterium]|nr:hypothetical protein [Elusimicrobiota bacterium]
AAGTGVFGVGLFAAPVPGPKRVKAGAESLGAGLFGAGGAWLAGAPLALDAGAFSMGAAAYGVGVLDASGDGAELASGLDSQGFGFTRGAGLFVYRGSGARLDCGLRTPDAHEDLALTSLCQGAGVGPRAFAGGGVGTALVEGSSVSLNASYMAQGVGYWHGLGVLVVRGDRDRLQARRYAQGTGVHTALGLLSIEGSSDTTRVWGVGPAFGWDWGVGWTVVSGDGDRLASEWAAARGDLNGEGFLTVRGDHARLALADAGAGAMRRNAPSWAVLAARGTDDVLNAPTPDAWGTVEGFSFDPDLKAEPADWPRVDRSSAAKADEERFTGLLRAAGG